MKTKILLIALFLSLLVGCAKKENETDVIARVGKSVLTNEDLWKRLPAEYSSFVTRKQNMEYVRRWVESEILYQEALKRKVHKLSDIQKKIKKAEKDILVAEMMDRLCRPSFQDFTEAEIQRYYEEHRQEFVRNKQELKAIHILVPGQKKAYEVKRKIKEGNFIQLAKEYSIDPVEEPSGANFIPVDEMLPELARAAAAVSIGGTTRPVSTPKGYYILKILDKQPANTQRALEEVHGEITSRLIAGRQKDRIKNVVKKLEKEIPVEYYLERLPAGTADSLAKPGNPVLPTGDR